MNIEDLAVQGRRSLYGNLAERNYSEYIRSRNNTLHNMFSDSRSMRHKNEVVANIKGVNYVDDAKSVKPNSTWFTFEQTSNPIIWILEAGENIQELTSLIDEVKQKVHTLIMVGEDRANIKKTFSTITNFIQLNTLEEAVKTAYYFANEPDVVIYSPASGNEQEAETNGERFLNFVNNL